ncbi:MAG: TIGR02265 family protein [Myxococcota bacterium]
MNDFELERWADSLRLPPWERDSVLQTLRHFPVRCRSRGMFASGVLKSVERVCGASVAAEVQRQSGYPRRITSFTLYPHVTFYRLFYASASLMFPTQSLGEGMQSVAETFYPIFSESLAGRTMKALLGRTPEAVLARFVDAYRIATPWNEHAVEFVGTQAARWKCMVEPCDFYEYTFAGICTGMVRAATGVVPTFEVVERSRATNHQRLEMMIRW